MWKCENCGAEVENNFNSCWNCGYGKDGIPPENRRSFEDARIDVQSSLPAPSPVPMESGFSAALRICGLVYLVGSVIGGIVILVVAPPSGTIEMIFYKGFAVAATSFQGIFVFVLTHVLAEISERVKAIQHNLLNENLGEYET
ncbi:MAG TPA: hypothetical protein VGW12_04925 [Pyrinomonadaceae bacterium]|nr:hypothetical protein [Pyrinomonadaceae bacterium]